MLDPAFMPFSEIVERMAIVDGEIVDRDAGVRSRILSLEIDSPVELDIVRDESGALCVGSTPPLYYVDTSIRPSFHRLSFTATVSETSDAG